jgi:hypothetical protein
MYYLMRITLRKLSLNTLLGKYMRNKGNVMA